MAASSAKPKHIPLPPELLMKIAAYLDVESLMALQESALIPWSVCEEPALNATVKLSPHSTAATLLRYLVDYAARLPKILRLTNCFGACTNTLFMSLSLCECLTELYCVNCALSPRRLFDFLCTSMPVLTRLEWSLFEKRRYLDSFEDIATCALQVVPKMSRMYVEVAGGFASYCLLNRIKNRCLSLKQLHVHALDANQSDAITLCWNFADPNSLLESFAYTSQGFIERNQWSMFVVSKRFQPSVPDFCLTASVCGNVAYRMYPPASCTCVRLKDAIASTEVQIWEGQLILSVDNCRNLSLQLAEVAERHSCQRLRSLTLVLLPPSMSPYTDFRCVDLAYSSILRSFIGACSNLTELNLTFVHFERGTDWCQAVASASVSKLRAVALLQCAIQTPASIEHLASSCPMLEELDVRGRNTPSSAGFQCSGCSRRFKAVDRDSVATLHRCTRLQRLTLYSLSGLLCICFLTECSVVRLRLSWPLKHLTCCAGQPFTAWLRSSAHLRSLTLFCRNVALSAICTQLACVGAQHLRNLCIVSGDCDRSECAERSVFHLLRWLPLLDTVHAHYSDEQRGCQRVTWVRRWRYSRLGEHRNLAEGVLLTDAPCTTDCSMTTFIGLNKPRS